MDRSRNRVLIVGAGPVGLCLALKLAKEGVASTLIEQLADENFLDQVPFWNTRDLERKLGEFRVYYSAARSHASLDGRTPSTFVGEHVVGTADPITCARSLTAEASSSCQPPLDKEFETPSRRGSRAVPSAAWRAAGAHRMFRSH